MIPSTLTGFDQEFVIQQFIESFTQLIVAAPSAAFHDLACHCQITIVEARIKRPYVDQELYGPWRKRTVIRVTN